MAVEQMAVVEEIQAVGASGVHQLRPGARFFGGSPVIDARINPAWLVADQFEPRLQIESHCHVAAAGRDRIDQALLHPGDDIESTIDAGRDLGDHANVEVEPALALLAEAVDNGLYVPDELGHHGGIFRFTGFLEVSRVPVEVERDAVVVPTRKELFDDRQLVLANLFVGEIEHSPSEGVDTFLEVGGKPLEAGLPIDRVFSMAHINCGFCRLKRLTSYRKNWSWGSFIRTIGMTFQPSRCPYSTASLGGFASASINLLVFSRYRHTQASPSLSKLSISSSPDFSPAT